MVTREADGSRIEVDLQQQTLVLLEATGGGRRYTVSTAANGPGEQQGSGCTPRGRHGVRIMIGEGMPRNTVFRGRRPTGEIYTEELARRFPDRDWILTRIIWLSGRERGVNRGGNRDTLRRYIYIHGCPDSEPMGIARSHGCIRMHNDALLDLFERVRPGIEVNILG